MNGKKENWKNLCSCEEVLEYYFCGGILEDLFQAAKEEFKNFLNRFFK